METILAALGDVGEDINKKSLEDVIRRSFLNACGICMGYGHVAKDCGTKKDMDVHFKLMKYGSEWGMVKSRAMSETMSNIRRELRKRTAVEFNRELVGVSMASAPIRAPGVRPTGLKRYKRIPPRQT